WTLVRLLRHDRPLRQAERLAAAAAQRRWDRDRASRPGKGRRAARQPESTGASAAGQLHVAAANNDSQRRDAADGWVRGEWLESIRHLERRDGPLLLGRRELFDRRRQPGAHRIARLR